MRFSQLTQGQRMTRGFRWGVMTCLIALVVMSAVDLVEVILGSQAGFSGWLPYAAGAVAMLPMLGSDLNFRRWLLVESFREASPSEARKMRGLVGDRFLIAFDLAKFAAFAVIIGAFLSIAVGIFNFIPSRFIGQPGQILVAVFSLAFFAATAVYFAIRWRWPLRHDEFLIARVPRLDLILVDPSRAPRISFDGDEKTTVARRATRKTGIPWRAFAGILGGVAVLTFVGYLADRSFPQLGGGVSQSLSPILQPVAILALLAWGVWAILRQRRRP